MSGALPSPYKKYVFLSRGVMFDVVPACVRVKVDTLALKLKTQDDGLMFDDLASKISFGGCFKYPLTAAKSL